MGLCQFGSEILQREKQFEFVADYSLLWFQAQLYENQTAFTLLQKGVNTDQYDGDLSFTTNCF